jgi:hypothetical protein
MGIEKGANWVFPKERSFSDVLGKNTHRATQLGIVTLTLVGTIIGNQLTATLTNKQGWGSVLVWAVAGITAGYFLLRLQGRSQKESPEAIRERVTQLKPELRKQVQARSFGARRQLIEAPLRELDLNITPRLKWVLDPRLIKPEPLSEQIADDVVLAFESSKRRMLIVGEPGSGKTIAAYSLIEYLDNTEGDKRIPLLVNLSAWEAQDSFEDFLVDYLCSSVGYQVRERAVARAFIDSDRYNLILDGLDEIPVGLRAHFSERLDEYLRWCDCDVQNPGVRGAVGLPLYETWSRYSSRDTSLEQRAARPRFGRASQARRGLGSVSFNATLRGEPTSSGCAEQPFVSEPCRCWPPAPSSASGVRR